MRKSNRLRSKLGPGHDIPDGLPAPSTSRPILPRSRATSLARSGSASASRHASRGRSYSHSSLRSSAMEENITGVDTASIFMSDWEPVASPSSHSLDTGEDNEAGGSLSTSSLKRKRSGSDDDSYPTMPDVRQPMSSSPSSLKGKGKVKEFHLHPPDIPEPTTTLDSPENRTSDLKGKSKALHVEPKPKEELLGSYSCPICFSPPSNATLTPCGHICCGVCLFMAVKTTMQRATMMMAPEGAIPRCPVCRATIPGWDGKGGGVIGLKARAILTL